MGIKNKKLRVLIATGIFPPDIGGPATFAKVLYDELPKHGCDVKVVTYSNQDPKITHFSAKQRGKKPEENITLINRRKNIFFRYFKYFLQVWRLASWADVIYAFDIISVGLPCATVKLFKPKIKLIVRLGGDHQWEMAIQQRRYHNTMEQYYIDKKFNFKERLIYTINNFVLKKANFIIFNANIIRDIYLKYRNIDKKKTAVIKNVFPKIDLAILRQKKEKDYVNFLYLGRMVGFKNLLNLVKSFSRIDENKWPKKIKLEIVGEGPEKERLINYVDQNNLSHRVKILPKLNHDEALNKIFNSDVFITVSLTEVNAHTVAEAMALNKYIILTRKSESYITDKCNNKIFYINPLDPGDIVSKIEQFLGKLFSGTIKVNESGPAKKDRHIAWNLDEVVKAYLETFNKSIK